MNRRIALGRLLAGAGGLKLGGALEAAAQNLSEKKTWPDAERRLTPAEVALERAIIAHIYLLDSFEEIEHLHDLNHPDGSCPCALCYDARGWKYLLAGPFDVITGDFLETAAVDQWERALEYRREVRQKEYAAYVAQLRKPA